VICVEMSVFAPSSLHATRYLTTRSSSPKEGSDVTVATVGHRLRAAATQACVCPRITPPYLWLLIRSGVCHVTLSNYIYRGRRRFACTQFKGVLQPSAFFAILHTSILLASEEGLSSMVFVIWFVLKLIYFRYSNIFSYPNGVSEKSVELPSE
jgi:hypothetical protein